MARHNTSEHNQVNTPKTEWVEADVTKNHIIF